MREHKLLNKLERKFGNYAIPNFMTIIVFGMALVFMIDTFINPEYTFNLSSLIYFNRDAIMHGEVWRLLTFIFMPSSNSVFFAAFALYFYWLIGSALENHWGSFRFNVYYLTGVIGTMIGGMITGYATNAYLNMSLFLAFAMLYANFQVLVFFVIPVKIKYMAWLDAILMMVQFVFSDWSGRVALLISFANFLLFFGADLFDSIRRFFRRKFRKRPPNNPQNQNWKNHWWDDNHNNPFH